MRDTVPENKTIAYSYPRPASNSTPYIAFPRGWEHMETVRIKEITFPVRCGGVSVWMKVIICTMKIVEHTIIKKQQMVSTR